MKTFASGAVRGSEHKPMTHLISTIFLRRLAATLEEGLRKGYPAYNWMKGFPAEDVWDHLVEHLHQFLDGNVEEDHLGHAAFNLMVLVHFSETQPDLFDGMPPGAKTGMLKFLALCNAASEAPAQAEVGPRNPANTEVKSEFRSAVDNGFISISLTAKHSLERTIASQQRDIEDLHSAYKGFHERLDRNRKAIKEYADENRKVRETIRKQNREIESLTQRNAEQALEITKLKDLCDKTIRQSMTHYQIAEWLENLQRDRDARYKASETSHNAYFSEGWHAAFQFAIETVLKKFTLDTKIPT